jgi:hypothetical protein
MRIECADSDCVERFIICEAAGRLVELGYGVVRSVGQVKPAGCRFIGPGG